MQGLKVHLGNENHGKNFFLDLVNSSLAIPLVVGQPYVVAAVAVAVEAYLDVGLSVTWMPYSP